MQFGIFSVGDVSTDPTTGQTISEHERIQQMVELALTSEQLGLDVFATGEHHNPPFVPSSPTTFMGYVAAQDQHAHPVDGDDAHHDQRPGQDRRGLRVPPASRRAAAST